MWLMFVIRGMTSKEVQELDMIAQKNNMSREQLVTDIS